MSNTPNYPRLYLDQLMELLGDELHARMDLVEHEVRKLLDSGWEPTPGEPISAVVTRMFQVTDYRLDPTSDLIALAKTGNEHIGQPNPTGPAAPVVRLGELQVQAHNACVARLEAYVPERQNPTNVFQGPTQYVHGDGNTANFTNLANANIDARSIHNAISIVREHIDEFQDDDREDVNAHLATVEDELAKPAPNQGRMAAAWRAIKKLIGTSATAAVGATVDSMIKMVITGGGGGA